MPGRSIHARRARQNPVAWLYRWILGRPLNGAARTNASFLHPATKNESGYFWTMAWHRCAQWKVAVVRWGVTLWLLLSWRFAHAWVTFLGIGFMVAIPYLVYWAPRLYDLKHYRNIVSPLARAIGPVMGIEKTPADNYIDINRRFVHRLSGQPASVNIPHSLAGQPGPRKMIEEACLNIFAANAHDLLFRWAFNSAKAKLFLMWAPAPPNFVSLETCSEKLQGKKDSHIFLGIARNDQDVLVDIDNESPHVMISMGTGAGKSAASRSIGAQAKHNDCDVVILDIKRISHKWAESVPGIRIAKSIAEIHECAVELGEELDRRIVATDKGHRPGKRMVIIVEEMNMLTRRLKDYWDDIREKGQPKRSPAIAAINDMLFGGRQLEMNCVLIGQYLTANTVGGTEARENLGIRIMGRFSPQSWKNLAGDISMPFSSRHPGRVYVVSEGIATECQLLYMSDEEAIAWATNCGINQLVPTISHADSNSTTPNNTIPSQFHNADGIQIEGLAKLLREMNTET